MKHQNWKRLLAFTASAAMVFTMPGMQKLAGDYGWGAKAAELIIDEEDAASEEFVSENSMQVLDTISLSSDDDFAVEGMEEVENPYLADDSSDGTSQGLIVSGDTDPQEMIVEAYITECIDDTERAEDGSKAQGETQWMHVYVKDSGNASSGQAEVKIHLLEKESEEPAAGVEARLYKKYQKQPSGKSIRLPIIIKGVLNENEDLTVERKQEYLTDEYGEYKKDKNGNNIVVDDYLKFTLTAGDYAEFNLALLYNTDEESYEYTVLTKVTAEQVQDGIEESVLYENYEDEDYDNELTVTWKPQPETAESETEVTTETESETESETEAVTEAATEAESESETEAATEEESESETEAVTEAESESETEAATEAENESETEAATEEESESETEAVTEAESESETEVVTEAESESETETVTEAESESETEAVTESESEAETEDIKTKLPADMPISNIRVTMTKELEETEAPETEPEAEILSEDDIEPADEFIEKASEPVDNEPVADEAENTIEDTAQKEPAVSGQTYVVHVKAEDTQQDAEYGSTVRICLTDIATGLPASDVVTTVAATKEEVHSAEPAAVNTLYDAAQGAEGTVNLTVTRVQETGTAEDGTQSIVADYLEFELPAGGSADFYIGFTYEAEEAAYEKQMMIEVKAVQYIPVSKLEAEPEDSAAETKSDSTEVSQQTTEMAQSDTENETDMAISEGLFDETTANTADAGQELPSATAPVANEGLGVKTQAAEDEEPEQSNADSNMSVEAVVVTSENADGNSGTQQVVAVDVLETQVQQVMMWSATARSTETKTVYFDTCGNGDWHDWTKDCQIYIYPINANVSDPILMTKSTKKNTFHNCEGILWEYTITDSNCTGVVFVNKSSWQGNAYQTVDVKWSDHPGIGSSPCFKLNGSYDTSEKKEVAYLGEMKSPTYADETMYFMDFTTDVTSVKAIFSTDAAFSNGNTQNKDMTITAENSSLYSATIPEDTASGDSYKYVKFVDAEGNILGKVYNFYEESGTSGEVEAVPFESGSTDTFYYGATECEDGSLLHAWGAHPGSASLAQKTLYFDSSAFPVNSGGKFQIGDGKASSLAEDSKNPGTFSFLIPENSDATQQTILTFITSDGTTKYHFLWTDAEKNLLIKEDEIAFISEIFDHAVTVYYDATLSKLSYAGTGGAKNSGQAMPYSDSADMWCYITKADKTGGKAIKMTKAEEYKKGANIWNDVWSADIPEGYTRIRFTAWTNPSNEDAAQNGDGTAMMDIPMGLTKPCFYGDTSDDIIYTGGDRGGYWDEAYTIRDAEAGKKSDVVDISSSTFVQASNTLYVNSTFYDYYTDYELNGSNRDTYGGVNEASYRNWVNFRQFNQALSEYYRNCNASIPLYTGHFQPSISGWGLPFSNIAGTLGLFGWGNYNNFISTNNSSLDINGNGGMYAKAAQGLVSDTLSGGLPTVKNGSAVLPHFNEAFLTGTNSKNAVLGEVYHNVSFPFTKKEIDGVEYWCFDSKVTTLALRQDTSSGSYYLQDVGNQGWSQNVTSTGTLAGNDTVSTTYGFFPFNETSFAVSGKNYNYGFGTKLELKFRLTEDGRVKDKNGNKVPIKFEFSGDDDVWVFIDGKLALDVGGDHGCVTGTIDFGSTTTEKTATVSDVKASAGSTGSTTSKFNLVGSNTSEHTLTMFYMERGMWESNMKLTFNFPDENQLEVEKQVDKSEVNPLFSDLFDELSLFTFSVKNLATHFQAKEASGQVQQPETFKVSRWSSVSGNTCESSSKDGIAQTHWYAALEDKTGSYRSKRYGILNGETLNITDMRYLEFQFYYDYQDTPSLANMYLQLVDSSGKVKGNTDSSADYLSGKTYGAVTMAGEKWITLKIDLSKLAMDKGFNNEVVAIKFGYNYPRDIYLSSFTFYPSAVVAEQTGFVTKQYDIPDYGSAKSGELEIPEDAVYTSSEGTSYTIGADGTFVLKNGESVTFRDQFRRGSYIYLQEEVDPDLFDTVWTMYENGLPVTSLGNGETVTNGNVGKLSGVSGTVVDDGRTERVQTGTEDGQALKNAYNGQKPENTFVFRSYTNPDDTASMTKLKAVFTNKVKTGSLTIRKDKAYEADELKDTYKFRITYTNVGGIGLESNPIEDTVELKAGQSKTITGIPIGTIYAIEEIEPTDGSSLKEIRIEAGTGIVEEQTAKGVITPEQSSASVTFINTKKPLVKLNINKLWKNQNGTDITDGLPDEIFAQLQRKEKNSQEAWETVQDYERICITQSYEGWVYEIDGLDRYKDYETSSAAKEWEYRVAELDADGNIMESGAVSNRFQVSYSSNQTENTGTVTGVTYTITNTQVSKTSLQITKVSASNPELKLSGVEFELEKLASDGDTVDPSFEKKTGITDENGIAGFNELEDGRYRLTEVKAASGYSLLKSPVIIVIDRSGASGSTVDGQAAQFSTSDSNLILITIANQAKFQIPATGSWSRYIISFTGLMMAGAAIIMYLLRKRRKEGQAS